MRQAFGVAGKGMSFIKGGPIALAAFMLWVAGCMGNLAMGAGFDEHAAPSFGAALERASPWLLARPGDRLPLDSRLPERAVICSVVRANLPSSAFASPSTTDPDIDSIAAVTANPTNSNPDTARIQSALNSCHPGGVVKLAAAGQYDAFLAGALTLPSGVTLWVDSRVTLYASRYPADFTASGLVAGDECGNASATTTGK